MCNYPRLIFLFDIIGENYIFFPILCSYKYDLTVLQLTAVTIRFDAETVTVEAMRKETSRMPRRGRAAAGAADGASTQLELFPLLEPLSKGIMEKTMPVLWNGEDLDIPTFKRRNAAVDNGKLVGE